MSSARWQLKFSILFKVDKRRFSKPYNFIFPSIQQCLCSALAVGSFYSISLVDAPDHNNTAVVMKRGKEKAEAKRCLVLLLTQKHIEYNYTAF